MPIDIDGLIHGGLIGVGGGGGDYVQTKLDDSNKHIVL
jgi:hypothetical protein